MADTYAQVYLHFIFTPKFRASLIQPSWESELYKYVTGITKKNAHKMLAINGTADHVQIGRDDTCSKQCKTIKLTFITPPHRSAI